MNFYCSDLDQTQAMQFSHESEASQRQLSPPKVSKEEPVFQKPAPVLSQHKTSSIPIEKEDKMDTQETQHHGPIDEINKEDKAKKDLPLEKSEEKTQSNQKETGSSIEPQNEKKASVLETWLSKGKHHFNFLEDDDDDDFDEVEEIPVNTVCLFFFFFLEEKKKKWN